MADTADKSVRVITDKLVQAFYDAFIEAYINYRKRWRPDLYHGHGLPQPLEKMFWQAARELAIHDIDPYEYVNYVCEEVTKAHDDVYPNVMASRIWIKKFLDTKDEREAQLKLVLQLQAAQVKQRLESGELLRDILLSPSSELGVVFRAAAANAYGLPDLVDLFREDARKMLMFKPAYKKYLGSWLPKDLLDA